MTDDLERLWDDLPVGPAPTEAILAAARGEGAPPAGSAEDVARRRLRRSLTRVATVGGIAAAFVAGVLVSQPGSGEHGPSGPGSAGDVVPAAFHGALHAAPSCDALLRAYVDRAVDLVGPYGWGMPQYDGPMPLVTQGTIVDDAPSSVRGPTELSRLRDTAGVGPQRATSSDTGTNVQEAGVDEPDVVKTDGDVLVRLDGGTLVTYDVSGSTPRRLGDVDLDDLHHGQLLLAGDTVVAVGDDGSAPRYRNYGTYGPMIRGDYLDDAAQVPQTRVISIDIGDPADPKVTRTIDYDAGSIGVRQHGDDVRVVLDSGLPDLDFVTPQQRGKYPTEEAARKHNEQVVRDSTLDDWLPTRAVDGGEAARFLDCADVALPRDDVALGTMTVTGFAADAPDDTQAIAVATETRIAYESVNHLYLAVDDTGDDQGTTHLYDFTVQGTGASYNGDGRIDGRLADRWSMDEKDGVLRLAVEPTSETGDFTSLVTMKPDGDRLVEYGRLDHLGRGQELKSVRWFDDLALLVTFRRIDPLYAVDLSDQAHPRKLGELKVPGFSDYLHPLGPRKVIGVGEGRAPGHRWGAQAALLNLHDVEHPRQQSVVHFPGMQGQAGLDPRQFTWLPEHRVALTVLSRWSSRRVGYVAVLTLSGGRIHSRLVQVEYGNDVDAVRLVPLPGEKVALVTGDDVAMFDYR